MSLRVKDRGTTKSITFTVPEDPDEKANFLSGWDLLRITYYGKAIALYKRELIMSLVYHPNRKVKVCKENGKEYVIIKIINAKF